MFRFTSPMAKRFRTAALATTGLVLLAGVAGCSPTDGDATDTVLTIALQSGPTSLDPSQGSGGSNAIFQEPAYQGLLHITGTATLAPSLAESFEWVGDDNKTFQVVLRSGLKFSDGTPLDSDAVKKSIEHFQAGDSVFVYVANAIDSIETPDPLTVIFHLKDSAPSFPQNLAEGPGMGMIISPSSLADDSGLETSTVGAGPYVLDEKATISGSVYTYVPNEYYYDESLVAYSKVVIKVISDANTALGALQSGQVDVTYGFADTYDTAKKSGVNAVAFPVNVDGLWLQDQDGELVPALKDLRVRQAMQYAIDREAVSQAVTLGTGAPTAQNTPEDTIGYDASLEDVYSFDLDRAAELMDEAGYADGFDMSVTVNAGDNYSRLAQALVAQLAEIKINVTIIPSATFPEYAALESSGDYPGTVVGLATTGMPSAMDNVFWPGALVNPRQTVYTDLVAAATEAAGKSGDDGEEAWQAVNRIAVEQALVIPVTTDSLIYYWSDDVEGVDGSAFTNPVFFAPAE